MNSFYKNIINKLIKIAQTFFNPLFPPSILLGVRLQVNADKDASGRSHDKGFGPETTFSSTTPLSLSRAPIKYIVEIPEIIEIYQLTFFLNTQKY